MFRSNSTSSEASDPSVGIQYEMEDESQEDRNCEFTDFVCSDTDAERNTDIKGYFDKPIAEEAWLDNYRKKYEEGWKGRKILSYVGMKLSRFQHGNFGIPIK